MRLVHAWVATMGGALAVPGQAGELAPHPAGGVLVVAQEEHAEPVEGDIGLPSRNDLHGGLPTLAVPEAETKVQGRLALGVHSQEERGRAGIDEDDEVPQVLGTETCPRAKEHDGDGERRDDLHEPSYGLFRQ